MANTAMLVILAVFFVIAAAQNGEGAKQYLGCFPNPLIAGMQFGPGYRATEMTVEECQGFCYGKAVLYAYLRNGECLCDDYGDFSNPAKAVHDSVCSVQLEDGTAGSPDGQYVSAYISGMDYSSRVLNYCWSVNPTAILFNFTLPENQPSVCISMCSAWSTTALAAGVWGANGEMCSCLTYDMTTYTYGSTHPVLESTCNTPCPGLWSATCGGANAMDIYPLDNVYQGCYSGSLPVDTLLGDDTTPEACQDECFDMGYAYSAVSDGDDCTCGNSLSTLTKVAANQCNSPCAADSTQSCGGAKASNIYQAHQVFTDQETKPAGWTQTSSSAFGISDYGTEFGKK